MVICHNCGKETPDGKFCESCGAPLQVTQTFQQPPHGVSQAKKKNPALALIASFILCGVGQMYNGQILKGVIMLVVLFIAYLIAISGDEALWVLYIILWLFGMYDAYTTAVKINNGAVVETFTTRA